MTLAEITSETAVLGLGASLAVVLGVGALVRHLRESRKAIADEIRREIEATDRPKRVEVQSPLEMRKADDFVRRSEFSRDNVEIRDELKRHAARRAEIYEALKEQSIEIRALKEQNEQQSQLLSEVRADQKQTNSKVDTMIGEGRQLTQQLHQLTIAMQRKGSA